MTQSAKESFVIRLFLTLRHDLVEKLEDYLIDDHSFRSGMLEGKIPTFQEALTPVREKFKEEIPANCSSEALVEKLIEVLCLSLWGYSRLFVIENHEVWKSGLRMSELMQRCTTDCFARRISSTLHASNRYSSCESSATRLYYLQELSACSPINSAERAAKLFLLGVGNGGADLNKAGSLLERTGAPKDYGKEIFKLLEAMAAKGEVSKNLGAPLDSLLTGVLSILGYKALQEA